MFRTKLGMLFLTLATVICIGGCGGNDVPSVNPATTAAPAPKDTAKPEPSASARFIKATPNPVHVEKGKMGVTTIQWDTGDHSLAEVYMAAGKKPEEKFAGANSHGSVEAPWISKGGKYEFLL